jgi:Sec-independent protein secretion pathway component TatC
VITALILLISPALGLLGLLSYFMLIPLFTLWLSLLAYERQWLCPGITLEALVETNFLLTGLLALIWQTGQ